MSIKPEPHYQIIKEGPERFVITVNGREEAGSHTTYEEAENRIKRIAKKRREVVGRYNEYGEKWE